jgi:divalent metal cation (Fe/Co/Zn/Cd) transporter
VIVALVLFTIVRGCLAVVPWDEPLRRIAGLGAGLALFPAAWWIGVVATGAIFGIVLPTPVPRDLFSSIAAIAAVVAFVWFTLFSIFVVYQYRSAVGAQLKLL